MSHETILIAELGAARREAVGSSSARTKIMVSAGMLAIQEDCEGRRVSGIRGNNTSASSLSLLNDNFKHAPLTFRETDRDIKFTALGTNRDGGVSALAFRPFQQSRN